MGRAHGQAVIGGRGWSGLATVAFGVVSPVVVVEDLVKNYGSVQAVNGVSFEVQPGEVFALLGPNGAGKSTTVEILEGHRARTSGTVQVLGSDPGSAGATFRNRIGIVLQSSGIDPELTVREALDFYGAAYSRRRRSDEVMELVELSDRADSRVSTLSGGQQRRVDMALGLIGDPEVVFLDEPTSGFDPAARRRGWELVKRLASQQRAVLLTTHYMDEAQHLADRVAVLSQGRIVAEGTPTELRAAAGSTMIRFTVPDSADPLVGLLEPVTGTVVGRGRRLEISTDSPTADLAHITGWAAQRGIELEGLSVTTPSLEDVYLSLVAEHQHDDTDTRRDATVVMPDETNGRSTPHVGSTRARRGATIARRDESNDAGVVHGDNMRARTDI